MSVEDPRQLEKVILHLVTNLPSSSPSRTSREQLAPRISIIPHKKERILSAIDKIYTVITTIPKQPSVNHDIDGATAAPQADYFLQADTLPPLPVDDAYLTQSEEAGGTCSPGTTLQYSPPDLAYDGIVPYSSEQMNLQMYPPPANFQEQIFEWMPGTSAGVKRPKYMDRDDHETTTKKKVMADEPGGAEHSGRNSPSLEMFFDEASKSQ